MQPQCSLLASPFISPITDPLTNTATYATYSQIELSEVCVIECHIDQCQRDGGGHDEGQQMGDLEGKERKKYCGIGKNVVPLHRQKTSG